MHHKMGLEEKSSDKSRRELRKEARSARNKKKFDSWVQHRQAKNSSLDLNSKAAKSSGETELSHNSRNYKDKKDLKGYMGFKRTPKTKFFELLKMETGGIVPSAEEDLKSERRLSKKLKLKNGKLNGADDGIDMLLEGVHDLDNPSEIGKVGKTAKNSAFSRKSEKSNSMNEAYEASEDEISVDEDVQSDSLVSSDEQDEETDSPDSNDEQDEGTDSLDSNDEQDKADEELDSLDSSDEQDEGDEESDLLVSSEEQDDLEEMTLPKESNKGKRKKTKFEEYLETDIRGGRSLAEADLALERKLAKKLKVNSGKVQGDDDDINMLLEGIPSFLDFSEHERIQTSADYSKKNLDNSISNKNLKNSNLNERAQKASGPLGTSSTELALENLPKTGLAKYVLTHLRSHGGSESTEHALVRKRVNVLLKKPLGMNVESITGEVSALMHSVGRTVGSQIVSEAILKFSHCNEQPAAESAAFVAGMACSVGIDFGAKILADLAKCIEEEYLKEDNLSLQNLTLLFSYLYVFGLCSSELIYDFLTIRVKQLTELDVSTVVTVLQCCGMKLRAGDPVGMKNFISSVQSRVNELKASSENGLSNLSKSMELVLLDIKNNKVKSKEDTEQHTRIKKWLQKLKVDNILIRGMKWSKLLDDSKKGQWWLSGDVASTTKNIEEVAGTIDKEILETKKLLQIAVSQGMNTDARRAIFCVIMSGEDYVDAFEKLLRLDLPGKQDREIMRVLVECCLQEKIYNKYYSVLASKLCSHDKNHKFTLQYCLWDHFKELESMPLMRSMHLSKFVAEMVGSFSISLAVLKAVDLNQGIHLSPKRIMHFRMLFEAILELPDMVVWNIFTRLAVTSEYEPLRSGVEFFVSKYVVNSKKTLASKFKIARKALNNVEGVIM